MASCFLVFRIPDSQKYSKASSNSSRTSPSVSSETDKGSLGSLIGSLIGSGCISCNGGVQLLLWGVARCATLFRLNLYVLERCFPSWKRSVFTTRPISINLSIWFETERLDISHCSAIVAREGKHSPVSSLA
ncbi:hypothetical protein JCM19235_1934 [Vibrio maritimus]|uniref:Uncharacterized protein n=1 Tax=Vibrio maritimus TaxID=990268 RepID=A0A090RTD1_9VIBR|nr:hypothetical protein JCM19235_1934 [Vibrio maritimus]